MSLGNSPLDEVLDSDADSVTEYVPRSTRPKAPSIATKRRSRMLYLEKYGLNQPDWHKGSQDDYLDDQVDDDGDVEEEEYPREDRVEYLKGLSSSSEDDDDEISDMKSNFDEQVLDDIDTPTSSTADLSQTLFTAEPDSLVPSESDITTTTTTTCIRSKSTKMKSPVSVRTFVQGDNHQRRPARFLKPANQPNVDHAIPPEFTNLQALVEEYNSKVYMEGYLYKRNDLNSNGKSCNQKWGLWYVELCGPVLTLWDAECNSEETILPIYINITDASVKMEPTLSGETSNHVFSINSAGANRYLLQPPNKPGLEAWVLAVRLSCFECARIQEIYTREFVTRPMYRSILFPPTTKKTILAAAQGYVQVRFPGTTGWKKYWAVVTNKQVQKGFFSKKKVITTRGQVMFYNNQKSKQPVMTLLDVAQAYTVYPESPKLINRATLFKIEGSLYKNKSTGVQQLVSASSSALIMTASSEELVRWLVGVYDTFHLYGKPGVLFNDPTNKEALNFGHRKTRGRLFLEPTDVYAVSVEPTTTLMETKAHFNDILMNKMLSQPVTKRHTLSAFTELNIYPERQPSKSKSRSNPLRNVTCEDDHSSSVSANSRHSMDTRYPLSQHILQQHNNEFQTSPVPLEQSYSATADSETSGPRKAPSFSSSNNDSVLSSNNKRSSSTTTTAAAASRRHSSMPLSHHWPMFGSSGSVEECPTSPTSSYSTEYPGQEHHLGRNMFYNSSDSFHQMPADEQSPRNKTHFQPLDPIDEKAMFERYFLEQKQQLIMMQQYMYQQYGPTILTDPKYMIPNELSLHQDH
ncbi:hypothetical protein K501DRAFT_250144 [Backusella circina FSU 941]|nr:hypothetical protein K501DRAFT_250144 [Backusella circina FSU 941]